MRRNRIFLCVLLCLALLTGCRIRTVDQMYRLPRRSESYNDLQSAIDSAMNGLEYCAPVSGEYQQTVQMADLDGDGEQEYLLFAKGGREHPLKILIFKEQEGRYVHTETVECSGTAFDQVNYVQMDGKSGVELVVGRQLSDQVLRTVSAYSFHSGEQELILSANYSKFLPVDLDMDGLMELFVLHPGPEESGKGLAQYYKIGTVGSERSVEVEMSMPVSNIKRVLVGKMFGGQTAVYVASTVDESTIITDVYALSGGELRNVTFSNESGTSVHTLRNYYIYADDIDGDGETELPSLIPMVPTTGARGTGRNDLIRWYTMTVMGDEIDKLYTFHDFDGGWYLELDGDLAPRISVERQGSEYTFHIWNEDFTEQEKLMTIFIFTGQHREEAAAEPGRTVLLKTDSTIYCVTVEENAKAYGITDNSVVNGFQLISLDWKTGDALLQAGKTAK